MATRPENPFAALQLPWQCRCLVTGCGVETCDGLRPDGMCPSGYGATCDGFASRKSNPGTLADCVVCGERRPS